MHGASRMTLFLLVLAGWLLPGPDALAQDKDPATLAKAKELFKEGRQHLKDGKHGEAVAALTQAYELTKDGLVMGQVAVAYEQGGDIEGALKAITVYRDSLPKDKRGPVEKMIKKYKRLIKQGKTKPLALPTDKPAEEKPTTEPAMATTTPKPAVDKPVGIAPVEGKPIEAKPVEDGTKTDETKTDETKPAEGSTKPTDENAKPEETKDEGAGKTDEEAGAADEEEGKPKRFYTWIAAGSAAALALSGLVVGLNAQSKYDELSDRCAGIGAGCTESEIDSVKTRAMVADILFGVAAGAAITAGVLYFIEGRTPAAEQPASTTKTTSLRKRVRFNPVAGGGTYGLSADITF